MSQPAERVIPGVKRLLFGFGRQNTVMGALELALEVAGGPVTYDFLMGASGAAFRLQIAVPEWCPSAPYAGVGFDCIPHAGHAIGRPITWHTTHVHPPQPADPQARERRLAATLGSLQRGVPVLYGAEECGLIVGYRDHGKQLLLRTYFDPSDAYTVLDEAAWAWPGAGVLPATAALPERTAVLRASLERAIALSAPPEHYPHFLPGTQYVGGQIAYRAWIDGLAQSERFSARSRQAGGREMRGNWWCYVSLRDARSAAARYLDAIAPELGRGAAAAQQAAAAYRELVQQLSDAAASVPNPNDANAVWHAPMHQQQAAALEAAARLDRTAAEHLQRALDA